MKEVKNVEDVLGKIGEAFTIYAINIWNRDGNMPCECKCFNFKNAEAAIAAYGDEEVYEWGLESMSDWTVCVTIKLKSLKVQ